MIINTLDELQKIGEHLKKMWKTIVRTNGCFDLMHPWHIKNFEEAKKLWDVLIVWVNWDQSPYWSTKPWRPINTEYFRTTMVDALRSVDYVFVYNETTPLIPIETIVPDVLVKWWDYEITKIVWYDIVVNNWWKVVTVPIEWSYSTSAIITKILDTYKNE